MNPLRDFFLMVSRIPPAVMLLLIIGLAAVVAIYVTGEYGKGKESLEEQKKLIENQANAKGKVVFAVKDIPEDTTITPEMVEEREIAEAKIPIDGVRSAALVVARVAKAPIASGQVVSQHDLAATASITAGFESKLKPGLRAVTIPVDANSGVAGFINPSSHVDIYAIIDTNGQTKAVPILSDIEVVAVGQSFSKPQDGTAAAPTSPVTVAVTAEQAKRLIKVISAGKLYLTLRAGNDHAPVPTMDIPATVH